MDYSNNTKIYTISEVNSIMKSLVEESFMPFKISGEISSLLIHRSGHVYMNLKDNYSQIKATFFGGAKIATELNLKNGDSIEAFGSLSVYDVRGEYQFNIRKITPMGTGSMQIQFARIKQKLQDEGLFDQQKKLPIPQVPKTIGIVTSPTGAALRDFLQITNRRFSDMHIQIFPAQVQGDLAALDVARGIAFFNQKKNVDVIVIARGGGSMEDLWCFNDENLARVISKSKIPIISAIGHEIDFTICDFVADLRVPTPSAAAELVSSSQKDLKATLKKIAKDMKNLLNYRYMKAHSQFERIKNKRVLQSTSYLCEAKFQQLDETEIRLNNALAQINQKHQFMHELFEQKLSSLNPNNQLKRGYAVLINEDKSIVRSKNIAKNSKLIAKVADGEFAVTVD